MHRNVLGLGATHHEHVARSVDPRGEPLSTGDDPFAVDEIGTGLQLCRVARRDARLGDGEAHAVPAFDEGEQQLGACRRRGVLVEQQRGLERVGAEHGLTRLGAPDGFVHEEVVAHGHPTATDLGRMAESPEPLGLCPLAQLGE
ncbi:unannotated protein [freshwater metagenome]|uniref:Unannotated protein n=1 Tax=freshwater metagenome TaxID=449393 RepID=A0A6J7PPI1_9ZZZZ